MIKRDIVTRVSMKMGIPKVKAELAVDSVFQVLKAAMHNGERIELRGFGVFIIKPRKSGIGRNPRTGREIPIPPGKTVRFKPGKEIRDSELRVPTDQLAPRHALYSQKCSHRTRRPGRR